MRVLRHLVLLLPTLTSGLILSPTVHALCVSPAAQAARPLMLAKKAKKPKPKAGGFGAAPAAAAAGPTAAELLKRSQAAYAAIEGGRRRREELSRDDLLEPEDEGSSSAGEDEDLGSHTKYAITLRTSGAHAEFSDWVPIALLALETGCSSDPASLVPSAIGASCRELHEAAAQSFPTLRKIARSEVQWSFEPLDEFDTHVHQGLQGRAARRRAAEDALGLERGESEDPKKVKAAHRRILVATHPDSFVGDEAGAEAARDRMLEAQDAYAELGGGQGAVASWYEAIGGKARVSFSGALSKEQLGGLGKTRPEQEAPLETGGWRTGVFPCEVELAREFAVRNGQRAAARELAK